MEMLLEQVRGPQDIRDLSAEQLKELAEEIRHFLIDKISVTGGQPGLQPWRGGTDDCALSGFRPA